MRPPLHPFDGQSPRCPGPDSRFAILSSELDPESLAMMRRLRGQEFRTPQPFARIFARNVPLACYLISETELVVIREERFFSEAVSFERALTDHWRPHHWKRYANAHADELVRPLAVTSETRGYMVFARL